MATTVTTTTTTSTTTTTNNNNNNNNDNNDNNVNIDNNDNIFNNDNNDNNDNNNDNNDNNNNNNNGNNAPNNAPQISADTDTRSLPETVGDVAPISSINIGEPIEATDNDNDPLTYSLEGPDVRYFTIDRNSGQISTRPGVIYDYEARPTYRVTVKASDARRAPPLR